jgi:hypothetical protein
MRLSRGQLYFWNSTESFFAKAISYFNMRTFSKSKCVHVGVITEVNGDDVAIYEASEKGFVRNLYSASWINERIKDGHVHIGETKEKLVNLEWNCNKYHGVKYGWLDIIGIGFYFLTGIKLSLTGKNAIICSEAVSRVLYDCSKTIDFQKEYKLPYDQITPMHIFLSKQVRILA